MKSFIRLTNSHIGLLYCLFIAVGFGISGVSRAAAQDLVQPDGRINQVAHFGGDALYCVDLNMIATNDYPVMIADGGLRLLNSEGQLKWFVPAEDILDAIAQSKQTGGGVLVAEGEGTYGPVRLYTYFDGKDQRFVFSGYDEYGKPNSVDFVPCTPVGPAPGAESNSSDDSEPCIETDTFKLLTLPSGGDLQPCEEDCIPAGAKLFADTADAAKLLMPVSGAPLPPCEPPCITDLKPLVNKAVSTVLGIQQPQQSLPCCDDIQEKPFAGLDKNPTQPQFPCEQNTGCKPLAFDIDLTKRSSPFVC